MPTPAQTWDAIDHLIALDPGDRGIATIFRPGAAAAAARALRRARRVLIVTGFCVEPGLAETDGPPGAAALGRALRALGARVRWVTDRPVVPLLAAALSVLDEAPDIVEYADAPHAARALLAAERPTHLVAIERPGRNRAGDYVNMRGQSVAALNLPLDELFLARSRAVTVGVGDGGNEVGMGSARARLLRAGGPMARVASVVKADHLVVAGVSNWGAYGIVAALARLSRRPLLHSPAQERRMIEACVAAGAVDGVTRRRETTVDGFPVEVHEAVVALLGVSWGPR
ncbi:MAG: glutamate cyclase domain-containing protein [Candidatus Rokuibacteriota bacterium]